MKSDKELIGIYNKVKNKDEYESFEMFKFNCKSLIKSIKEEGVYCSLRVSKSGMTRYFGFKKAYNNILNMCYNRKSSYEPVKIKGCGMDMGWHLLYTFCQSVMTEKEIEKYDINYRCSHYYVI